MFEKNSLEEYGITQQTMQQQVVQTSKQNDKFIDSAQKKQKFYQNDYFTPLFTPIPEETEREDSSSMHKVQDSDKNNRQVQTQIVNDYLKERMQTYQQYIKQFNDQVFNQQKQQRFQQENGSNNAQLDQIEAQNYQINNNNSNPSKQMVAENQQTFSSLVFSETTDQTHTEVNMGKQLQLLEKTDTQQSFYKQSQISQYIPDQIRGYEIVGTNSTSNMLQDQAGNKQHPLFQQNLQSLQKLMSASQTSSFFNNCKESNIKNEQKESIVKENSPSEQQQYQEQQQVQQQPKQIFITLSNFKQPSPQKQSNLKNEQEEINKVNQVPQQKPQIENKSANKKAQHKKSNSVCTISVKKKLMDNVDWTNNNYFPTRKNQINYSSHSTNKSQQLKTFSKDQINNQIQQIQQKSQNSQSMQVSRKNTDVGSGQQLLKLDNYIPKNYIHQSPLKLEDLKSNNDQPSNSNYQSNQYYSRNSNQGDYKDGGNTKNNNNNSNNNYVNDGINNYGQQSNNSDVDNNMKSASSSDRINFDSLKQQYPDTNRSQNSPYNALIQNFSKNDNQQNFGRSLHQINDIFNSVYIGKQNSNHNKPSVESLKKSSEQRKNVEFLTNDKDCVILPKSSKNQENTAPLYNSQLMQSELSNEGRYASINNNNSGRQNSGDATQKLCLLKLNQVDRNDAWINLKNAHQQRLVEEKRIKDLQNCNFKPTLLSKNNKNVSAKINCHSDRKPYKEFYKDVKNIDSYQQMNMLKRMLGFEQYQHPQQSPANQSNCMMLLGNNMQKNYSKITIPFKISKDFNF